MPIALLETKLYVPRSRGGLVLRPSGIKPNGPQEQALIEPLSERELDVLRLLGSELDGPAMARELMVPHHWCRDQMTVGPFALPEDQGLRVFTECEAAAYSGVVATVVASSPRAPRPVWELR